MRYDRRSGVCKAKTISDVRHGHLDCRLSLSAEYSKMIPLYPFTVEHLLLVVHVSPYLSPFLPWKDACRLFTRPGPREALSGRILGIPARKSGHASQHVCQRIFLGCAIVGQLARGLLPHVRLPQRITHTRMSLHGPGKEGPPEPRIFIAHLAWSASLQTRRLTLKASKVRQALATCPDYGYVCDVMQSRPATVLHHQGGVEGSTSAAAFFCATHFPSRQPAKLQNGPANLQSPLLSFPPPLPFLPDPVQDRRAATFLATA